MGTDEVGPVTLNLTGEEAAQLLADLKPLIELSDKSEMDDSRRSIYDKLQSSVGRSMHRNADD